MSPFFIPLRIRLSIFVVFLDTGVHTTFVFVTTIASHTYNIEYENLTGRSLRVYYNYDKDKKQQLNIYINYTKHSP